MIPRYLDIARRVARRYARTWRTSVTRQNWTEEELTSEAYVGLCVAVKRLDPSKPTNSIERFLTLSIERHLINATRYHRTKDFRGRFDDDLVARDPPDYHDDTPTPLLDAVPEKYIDLVDLVWVRGWTHATAAEVLGCCVETIQHRLRRVAAILREVKV